MSLDVIKKIGSNKVIIYLVTRYLTYAIQFLTSLLIAVRLGPFYMGVWGLVLLVLNYLGQFHFGIANSLNVLLVQNKDSSQKYNGYITNSLFLILIISLFVGLFYLYTVFIGVEELEKYDVGKYMWAVCLIAVFQYFNGVFANIFRVSNRLNSISFTQSLVVIIPFIVIFLFKEKQLVDALVASYFISNLICVIYALYSGIVPRPKIYDINLSTQKELLVKGIFLFLYNTCFSFIVISIRTIVSTNYSIEEFGLFTFAFTLANAVMMLMDAFSFIAFPKVISLFCSNDVEILREKVSNIRNLYMDVSHFITYLFLLLMPILSYFMPQYHGSVVAFNLIVLALALRTNSFAHSSLLIARNQEKKAAFISSTALIINIFIGLFLVKVLRVGYNYVTFATLIANLYMCFAMYISGNRILQIKTGIKDFFPLRLLIPYTIAVSISVLELSQFLWVPVTVFIILNIPAIKRMLYMVYRIVKDSSIINI